MNKFLKALIVGLIVFLVHIIVFSVAHQVKYGDFGYYGFWGGMVFGLIVGYWAYFLATFIYLSVQDKKFNIQKRIFTATVVSLVCYLIARVGDAVDGDFFRKFDLTELLVFLFSIPLIVWLDLKIVLTGRSSR
jgi:hypothetical protein